MFVLCSPAILVIYLCSVMYYGHGHGHVADIMRRTRAKYHY